MVPIQMEKYNIYFGNCWSIENQRTINRKVKLDKKYYELPFGQYEYYQGKINWLFDPFIPTSKSIQECSNYKAFKRRATFYIFERKEDKWISIDSFKSDFIGALKYIQRAFKE